MQKNSLFAYIVLTTAIQNDIIDVVRYKKSTGNKVE